MFAFHKKMSQITGPIGSSFLNDKFDDVHLDLTLEVCHLQILNTDMPHI